MDLPRAASKELFAALPTPIDDAGRPALVTFARIVDFVVTAGVDGVCIGGATGEYAHFDAADRIAVVRAAAARLPGGKTLLAGVGTPSTRGTIDLGRAAIDAGARALLVPVPMFYRYEQDDVRTYMAHVSRTIAAPCLLYDLPDFTTPISTETAVALLHEEEFVTGIKDSSGRAGNLATFARERGDRAWTLLVGHDRLSLAGLRAGWDGGVSGLAAFCPELHVALFRSHASGDAAEAERLQRLLDDIVARVEPLPAPWGVRAGLAARGFDTGPLPLPLSARRQQQIRAFQEWLTPTRFGSLAR